MILLQLCRNFLMLGHQSVVYSRSCFRGNVLNNVMVIQDITGRCRSASMTGKILPILYDKNPFCRMLPEPGLLRQGLARDCTSGVSMCTGPPCAGSVRRTPS